MLIVKNCNLMNMAGIDKEPYDLAMENGIFTQIAPNITPGPGDQVVDAQSKLVTPGFIEPHCHLGMSSLDDSDINDITNPLHPALRAIDAIDIHSQDFDDALKTGVTTLAVGPGSSNLIGGTFAAIKSGGATAKEKILKEELCIKMALGENPKNNYKKMNRTPSTRMGEAALIRDALYRAREYRNRWLKHQEKLQEGTPDGFAYDLGMHSLMRVFDGFPVKIHAHTEGDIRMAIRIIQEFQLNGSIEHCTEGQFMTDELLAAGIPVIIGPTVGGKSKLELGRKQLETPGILERAGVFFSLTTDSGVIPITQLLMQVSVLIAHGLSEETAYKCVTIRAAKVLGLDDRLGSIEVGKDADLVIWNYPPFTTQAQAGVVIIGGTVQYQAKPETTNV